MLIMEMQHLIKLDEDEPAGCLTNNTTARRWHHSLTTVPCLQWKEVFHFDDAYKISPNIINKAVTALFLLPENRPHFIRCWPAIPFFCLMPTNGAWGLPAVLARRPVFTGFCLYLQALLCAVLFAGCKDTLAADSETVLMDALIEDSYKNAYEVTKT
jgi:hypothetical protein